MPSTMNKGKIEINEQWRDRDQRARGRPRPGEESKTARVPAFYLEMNEAAARPRCLAVAGSHQQRAAVVAGVAELERE